MKKLLHIGGEFDEIRCRLRSFPAFVEIGRGGPRLNRPGRSVFAAFGAGDDDRWTIPCGAIGTAAWWQM